jgi:DNA-directed RNA polymerase specialized sigma24 family protein
MPDAALLETRKPRGMPVHEPLFGLTHLEEHALVQCYAEGYTAEQVAGWCGTTRTAIAHAVVRACDKIEGQGMPRPQPYGRRSRDALRAVAPFLSRVI